MFVIPMIALAAGVSLSSTDWIAAAGTTGCDATDVDFSDARHGLASCAFSSAMTTADGGLTWSLRATGLQQSPVFAHARSASELYLARVGLYRSVDGGDSWDKVNDIASAAQPLLASDGTIYWAAEGDAGLVRSSDQGETWDGPFGAKELIGFTPAELPNGQLAMFGANRMVVSSDSGETWQAVSAQVPYAPSGFTYSATRKAFYVWHWTCAGPVPDDAIMAYDFDWEAAP
jgi:hypothetical protein